MHINETIYGNGQIVFLKTDQEQTPRMVTGIHFYPSGVVYTLSLGPANSDHYEVEITETADEVTRLGLKIEQK